MFERYTERARRIIFFARYEASQFGWPYIEAEHLLLAFFREEQKMLAQMAPTLAEALVRERADRGKDKKISTSVDLPLSNESKRVLAYAAEEGERLGDRHVGSEHLLLGLLREKKSLAAELLTAGGATLESVHAKLRQARGEKPTGMAPGSLYCPSCAREVTDPLTCGDCSAVICRVCGTPLESPDELGIG